MNAKIFRELNQIHVLEKKAAKWGEVRHLADVKFQDNEFPIKAFLFGPEDKTLPTFVILGGVHGIEKVGTHISLYFLRSFLYQMSWDELLRERLKKTRLLFLPLVNPGGMYLNRRSNPNGIDLMRNAPIDSPNDVAFLVGGHRYGSWLPWYRGAAGAKMEVESQTLVDFIEQECFGAQILQTLDIHSGFGRIDRLWYPYAKSRELFPERDHIRRFGRLLKKTNPYNVYRIERQSKTYTTHGDLWDYLFDQHYKEFGLKKTFLPWTLELGSWTWVKKNPRQIFQILGGFNPIMPHRYKRIMRRHVGLLEFFLRATGEWKSWTHQQK